jgi:hypothetical protein
MTHHLMNQMGHGLPNLIGVDPADFNRRLMAIVPEAAAAGHGGHADPHGGQHGAGARGHEPSPGAAAHGSAAKGPANGIPMVGAPGPRGYIAMGGMFTVLKVREGLTTYDDPGWYENPPGTEASRASEEDLRRDGIDVQTSPSPRPPAESPPAPHHHGHK